MVEHDSGNPVPNGPGERPDQAGERPDRRQEEPDEPDHGEERVGQGDAGQPAHDEPGRGVRDADLELGGSAGSSTPRANDPVPDRSDPRRRASHRYPDPRDSTPAGADRPATNERELGDTHADRTASDRRDLHRTPPGKAGARPGKAVGDGEQPFRATGPDRGRVTPDRPPAWVGDPPAVPPVGADPLIWRLAYGLYLDHSAHTDAFCVTCKNYWPCEWRLLAEHAFVQAFRRSDERRGGGTAGGERRAEEPRAGEPPDAGGSVV